MCCYLQTRVDPAKDIIYVNGNRLPKKQPPKVYLALNKPKGFVTVANVLFIWIIGVIYGLSSLGGDVCVN